LCGSRRTTGKSIPLKVAGFQVTLTGRFTPSPDRFREAGYLESELDEFIPAEKR
jgi:hypothetical protein